MSVTVKVDQREFQETLRRLAAQTSRSLDVFINSRLYHVSKEARAQTPLASRTQIEAALGATLQSQKVDKKGRTRRKYAYSPTPLVYGIVNARQKRAGKPPIPKSEMAAAAKKLIAGRLRAIGSLRSGWTRALGILASKIFESVDRSGPPVKQASTATPAKPGFSPTAMLEYRETVIKGGAKLIDPSVVHAAQRGFDKERGEMLTQLDKHMNKVHKKAGAA